ncbi:MAG: DUF1499 domain-containing protein [bacterium]|nr:DUF1499 domain-containing protein [bacterium]
MLKEQNNILIFVLTGFYLAIILAITAILSGLGTRWSFWDFRAGLKIFRWAVYGEMAVFALTLISGIVVEYKQFQNMFTFSVIGFLISVSVAGMGLKWMYIAKHVPAIHDITTDTENPPKFDLILNLRKDALNSSEYGGMEISSQQEKAYPDIKPALLEVTPENAYKLCLKTAGEMGWDIVNANAEKGFIEATDRTFWFGFKDDIVIRVMPVDKSSRIDLRSVSRVGRSDVGTNAKRIRNFFKRLNKKI